MSQRDRLPLRHVLRRWEPEVSSCLRRSAVLGLLPVAALASPNESRARTQAAASAVATNAAAPGGPQLARGGLALLAPVLVSAGLVVQAARLRQGGREA